MLGDDYQDLIKSLLDPTHEARRQMEELSGSHLAKRLLHSNLDASAALGRQARLGSAAEACRELANLSEAIDQQHRLLWPEAASPASLSKLAGSTVCDAAVSSEYTIPPSSLAETVGYRAPDMVALSNDAARLTCLDANLDFARVTQSCVDALDCMRDYFEQIGDAASALRPLETLSSSLYEQFGSALTARSLQQQLELHSWHDPTSNWQHDFHAFVALTSDAMGNPLHDSEEEVEDTKSDDQTVALDNENRDAPKVEVYNLAIRFVLPVYELQVRLRRLAARADHTAIGITPSLERMFLAVANAHIQYAPELVRIALPLVQRLAWPEAPTGSGMCGSIETISTEDAEEFEMYADAMKKLLKKIEESISE